MCFPSRRGNEQEVIVVMRPDKRACVPASLMLITHHTRAAAAEEVHGAIATAQERRIRSEALINVSGSAPHKTGLWNHLFETFSLRENEDAAL